MHSIVSDTLLSYRMGIVVLTFSYRLINKHLAYTVIDIACVSRAK